MFTSHTVMSVGLWSFMFHETHIGFFFFCCAESPLLFQFLHSYLEIAARKNNVSSWFGCAVASALPSCQYVTYIFIGKIEAIKHS